jgi:hypothetical protein
VKRVTSPDGREWEVRASRFRLPPWRQNNFDPWNYTTGILDGLFAFLILLPFFLIIVPVAAFLAEFPVAVARGLFSADGWIEAVCWYPQTLRIRWHIEDRHRLGESVDHVTQQLARGYDGLTFGGAEIVEITPPAGLNDLSS